MKILTRNKIVEAFHFPFTEALVFSILVWTSWGLAEAFYWNRIAPMLSSGQGSPVESNIYWQAFFIYVGIAAFWASILYVLTRILLASFHLHNTRVFRACTLCAILGTFFVGTLFYGFNTDAWQNALSPNMQYLIAAVVVLFAIVILVLLYRWGSSEDFRIRRSGTMMLSILVISLVLSFVPFPLFSEQPGYSKGQTAQAGYRYLMAYHYLSPLLKK